MGEQDVGSWLPHLPTELVCAVFEFVAFTVPFTKANVQDLGAWCLTCSSLNQVCTEDARYRLCCLVASPVLFSLRLSPVFGGPVEPLAPAFSWKLRAQLAARHLPQRLLAKGTTSPGMFTHTESANPDLADQTVEVVDAVTGRIHTNVEGDMMNLITDQPFLNTNRKALWQAYEAVFGKTPENASGRDHLREAKCEVAEVADNQLQEEFMNDSEEQDSKTSSDANNVPSFLNDYLYRGVDYFEVHVARNTKVVNRASGVGISRPFDRCSFIGWTKDSLAYHSDDGTVRRTGWFHQRWKHPFRQFATGDIVGCGIDWEAEHVFFVHIRPPTSDGAPPDVEVLIKQQTLLRAPWHPVIASLCKHDVLKINTGQEPFTFPIQQFIEQKRAGGSWTSREHFFAADAPSIE